MAVSAQQMRNKTKINFRERVGVVVGGSVVDFVEPYQVIDVTGR